jgi:dipeptidase
MYQAKGKKMSLGSGPGGHSPYGQSCDTVVALSERTGGGVLLAKNSDRPAGEAQRLIGVPAAEYAPGAQVRCQYLSIPQAPRTAALIGSQPYWLWGFEHGLNEHGVAIGNEAIFTREQPQETGLLGMDLLRLGLERGTTAQQALGVITALLERFGQGGSAAHEAPWYYDNSFLIADPQEAWVLETAGRRWAARRLTRGGYAISNRPTIGSDYDLASADLVAHAEARGWWPRGRRPFDFAEAYTDPAHDGLPGATCRLQRSRAHLAAGEWGALSAPALMRLLRDHGPDPAGGTGWLSWPTGREVTTVCMHGLAEGGATAASMVAELMPGAPPRAWASMAPPCTGVFVPCWVDTGPPAALGAADGVATTESPWWRYRRLWEAVARSRDPGAAVDRIRARWQPLERQLNEHVLGLGPEATPAARRSLSERACAEALQVLARLEDQLVGAGAAP